MAQRSDNAKFEALGADLRRLMNKADPLGLIALGCPADEYDPEIRTIVPRLKEAGSVFVLQRIIHEEFTRWFGAETAGPRKRYAEAARLMWARLRETQTQ